jgi:hypothetical protein
LFGSLVRSLSLEAADEVRRLSAGMKRNPPSVTRPGGALFNHVRLAQAAGIKTQNRSAAKLKFAERQD